MMQKLTSHPTPTTSDENKIKTKKMDKRKSGIRCVLPHCGKTMRNTIGIKMFKFPPEGTILGNIWRQACGLPMDKGKIHLCATHFSKDLIGLRHRKRDAIPSLLLTSNNNEDQKTSVVTNVSDKIESLDKCELKSAEIVEPFCSHCEQNQKYKHFYMRKCILLQKQKEILQARINSYCKFQKRAQKQIFKLKNAYYKVAERSLRPGQDATDTFNSKVTKQKLEEKPIELIHRQNELEWELLTQATEDSLNEDQIYTEKKQCRISKLKKAEEVCQAETRPIQTTEDMARQYNNEPLSSGKPDAFEDRRVKRNDIINRYRLKRRYFSSKANTNKRKRIKDKTKRPLQLLIHSSRKRRITNYSEQHIMEHCENEKERGETKTKTAANFPIDAVEVKIAREFLQEPTINTIPAKKNAKSFPNTQRNSLHDSLGSSKNSLVMVGTNKSHRCFRAFKESNVEGRFSNISNQPTNIDQRKVEESLENMRLLIKASAKCDRFTVFGKHITQKLSKSKKDVAEVKTAKALIDSILQNLAIGDYSSQNV